MNTEEVLNMADCLHSLTTHKKELAALERKLVKKVQCALKQIDVNLHAELDAFAKRTNIHLGPIIRESHFDWLDWTPGDLHAHAEQCYLECLKENLVTKS